jgi:hypothetical protein
MTAEALQTILDLQKKVDEYERFHLDLVLLLVPNRRKQIKELAFIPRLDHTEDYIYSEVKKMIENENNETKGNGNEDGKIID